MRDDVDLLIKRKESEGLSMFSMVRLQPVKEFMLNASTPVFCFLGEVESRTHECCDYDRANLAIL